MNSKRALEIVNKGEICDVFYEKEPVWIQEVQNNVATIGFLNGSNEKSVNIEDLYEKH